MSDALPEVSNYGQLLLANTPMIDTRAPLEFAKGSLPGAVNLPLMNDQERHQVGLCYKREGQQAAIELGHKLVCNETKSKRVTKWLEFIDQHPNGVLYCARGGLRSQLSQQWLADSGLVLPRVSGGYKSLRGYIYNYIKQRCQQQRLTVLSGMTGTGKTEIISALNNAVDLEGAANHKGSSFGRPLGEQPTQIDFENRVAIDFMRLDQNRPQGTVIIEDESRTIGRCALPVPLFDLKQHSPLVIIEACFEERLQRLWQEYVVDRHAQTMNWFGDDGEQQFAQHLRKSLHRVHKRLGGVRYQEVSAALEAALQNQHRDNFASHRQWLSQITSEYYDPMYSYQVEQRRDRVVFRGDGNAVLEWLQSNS